MNGRTPNWPRGKVLGGSSSINGLYMVRASEIEHNAWGDLNDARDRWGWGNMLAAMKKSENFHGPTKQVQRTVPSLKWNADSHGSDGPIHTGWPALSYPAVESFLQASANEGTPISEDPDNGQSWGTFLATSSIDNSDWQRSSSRTGYLNEVDQRDNLHVLINNQVTRILTNGTNDEIIATGVEFSTGPDGDRRQVYARREVILSGGAINSPMLLQLSGIGDAEQLGQIGINSIIDLPGVGHNIQDHLASSVSFSPKGDADMPPANITGNSRTDSFVNSAISYVNTTTLFGNGTEALIESLRGNLTDVIGKAQVRDEVKQAYNVTYTAQVDDVYNTQVGPIEILFALGFNSVSIQVALQHPLSRGSILITSNDPFASPAIDAGYLVQDIDLQTLRQGLKLARRIGTNEALEDIVGSENSPGNNVQTDGDWDDYIRSSAGTEYHPSSGCSMLPRDKGGVVDPNLLVYGTKNLRVVDSSVPPLAVSAHLMTITYGLAEIGSEIIIEARDPPKQSSNSAVNNSSDTNSSSSASDSNSQDKESGASQSQNDIAFGLITLLITIVSITYI